MALQVIQTGKSVTELICSTKNSVEPLNRDRQTLKKKDSLARFSSGCW